MSKTTAVKWTAVLLFAFCLFTLPPGPGVSSAGIAPPAPNLAPPQAPSYVTLDMVPSSIQIGFFFHEAKISLRGTLPSGCDAALILRGPNQESEMHVRGKKLGLWMAVGSATFKNAPAFYQCLTSRPIEKLIRSGTDVAGEVGFQGVKESMEVEVELKGVEQETGEGAWKDEFVAFQASRGLYYLGESELDIADEGDGLERVSGEIVLPARSPVGSYRAVLLALRDGVEVARIEEPLSVELMPPVAFFSRLAMEHGWIYGFVAVFVALGAGLGVGAIFQSKGAH